jgi:hypothetical protein
VNATAKRLGLNFTLRPRAPGGIGAAIFGSNYNPGDAAT